MIVTERLDGVPFDDSVREIQRNEKLLHRWPDPAPMNIWQKYDPIGKVNLPMYHVKGPFTPPQGVFESEYIHIEYQKMNGRQPFYHRNTDVDEITYHAAGKRMVLTELGVVDLEIGDMARIPVGVAHDNYAQEDVHIIFYIPQGVKENITPYRATEYRTPPFKDWQAANSIEFVTDHLSEIGSDCQTFYTSEQMLLDNAKTSSERMQIVKSSGGQGQEWLYKSEHVWMGFNAFTKSDGSVYTRHRKAEEIQIQVKGTRSLVTQRGTLKMEPGDFVAVPLGTAFTSVADEDNKYITVLVSHPSDVRKKFTAMAEETTEKLLEDLRGSG